MTSFSPSARKPVRAAVAALLAGTILVLCPGTAGAAETGTGTGSVSGKLLEANGSPVVSAQVVLTSWGTGSSNSATTFTKADGTYQIPQVVADEYTVSFRASGGIRTQYAYGQVSPGAATPVLVVAGQNTEVSDTMIATGNLKVLVTELGTGKALPGACAYLSGGGYDGNKCADGNGVITFGKVPAGDRHQLSVSASDKKHLYWARSGITVAAGQTTQIGAELVLSAPIETMVLDATTGQPVPYVCVTALGLGDNVLPEGGWTCSDASGKATISWLPAGRYRLFARVNDQIHGQQWVGENGGTGDPNQAAVITTVDGQVTTAPTVHLDPAGAVTGTVTDAVTGAPLSDICVGATPVGQGYHHIGTCPGATTDENGKYTISNLGPYSWPLELATTKPYAWQWSGGGASRDQATGVLVNSGQTATLDAQMSQGTTLTVRVVDQTGAPASVVNLVLTNAVTNDPAALMVDQVTGSCAIGVLQQRLRLSYQPVDSSHPLVWYESAADASTATVIDTSSTSEVTLVVPSA
jgi:hypothetical protein